LTLTLALALTLPLSHTLSGNVYGIAYENVNEYVYVNVERGTVTATCTWNQELGTGN
jgi:hypothetical protein